jgi:hypothetical protein
MRRGHSRSIPQAPPCGLCFLGKWLMSYDLKRNLGLKPTNRPQVVRGKIDARFSRPIQKNPDPRFGKPPIPSGLTCRLRICWSSGEVMLAAFSICQPCVCSDTYGGSLFFEAPSIITQPASQSVLLGQTVTSTVMARRTGPPSYQWNENGVGTQRRSPHFD